MNANGDDLALDRIEIYSREHLAEVGIEYPAELRADLHLRGGGFEQIGFLSIDSLRLFVRQMRPRSIRFIVGKFESVDDYEQQLIDGVPTLH